MSEELHWGLEGKLGPGEAARSGLNRRDFIRLAALAFAGACTRQPREPILPYVNQPPEITPGLPLYFATAMPLGGWAKGILVKTYEGRPVKIEGNPSHPASLGTSDAFMQAAILDLYDPGRSRSVMQAGQPRSWSAFEGMPELAKPGALAGLRILTGRQSSPTLLDQLRTLESRAGRAIWHEYESVVNAEPLIDWEDLEVVVSLDADLLGAGPTQLANAHHYAASRRPKNGGMGRLYVAESSVSLTGAVADSRLPVRSLEIGQLAGQILAGLQGSPTRGWVRNVVEDLRKHRAVVVAGALQPEQVHATVAQINSLIGAPTVQMPVEYEHGADLQELVSSMEAGQVKTVLFLGANPVYSAPADSGFAEALKKVPLRIHLGLEFDETAAQCHWHLPEAHFLETWSDARAFDGTETILQPVIEPLFGGRSAHELLSLLMGEPMTGYGIVQNFWKRQNRWPQFEAGWHTSLAEGVVATGGAIIRGNHGVHGSAKAHGPSGLEINFRHDPCVYDGRFAGNAWLQELPKPLTKLTWENAALISPATAKELGVEDGDLVDLTLDGRTVQAPVLLQPGHADRSVTVTLGYGRWHGGPTAVGLGFNAGALRPSDSPWFSEGLQLRPTGKRRALTRVRSHPEMEGRDLAREVPRTNMPIETEAQPPSFFDPQTHLESENQWGMVIDLGTCIGCNACIVACQAENNIPVVGKEQVALGREMHWLRVDRYFVDEPDRPRVLFQPVPCMHCESAPCELVCPVEATVHDTEGLNLQVYNRCVGTRYCSNNCPYKVRRFNFFEYNAGLTPSEQLQKNPNVTVRSRGVMEKCTYCLQRISAARIEAHKENRALRDGEVVTACAQACPADAIIFGNLHDPKSRVAGLRASALNYALLGELNTRPRTTYLAKIHNGP